MRTMKLRALLLSLLVAGLIAAFSLIRAKQGSQTGLQISPLEALPRVETGEQAAEMPTERPPNTAALPQIHHRQVRHL